MKRNKKYGSFFRKLSLFLLLVTVILIVGWISFQTFFAKRDDFSTDWVTKLLGVFVIVSIFFCVIGQIFDGKLKTASFGYHLSLLVCLSLFAINEYLTESGTVAMIEGEVVDSYKDKEGVRHPLPFKLRCDDVILKVYDDSYRVENYTTQLTVIENEQPPINETVSVNSPLTIKNYRLYQTDYGLENNPKHEITVRVKDTDFSIREKVKVGDTLELSNGMALTVVAFTPSWALADEQVITFNHDAMMNPGFLIAAAGPNFGELLKWIVFSNSRSTSLGNLSIEIEEVRGFEYTVLTVVKSPLSLPIEIMLLLTSLFGAKMLLGKYRLWTN